MRRLIVALALSMIASSAYANCKSEAAGLTGAAMTAALKKCAAEAKSEIKAAKPRVRANATPEAGPGDDHSMKHKYRPMATDER